MALAYSVGREFQFSALPNRNGESVNAEIETPRMGPWESHILWFSPDFGFRLAVRKDSRNRTFSLLWNLCNPVDALFFSFSFPPGAGMLLGPTIGPLTLGRTDSSFALRARLVGRKIQRIPLLIAGGGLRPEADWPLREPGWFSGGKFPLNGCRLGRNSSVSRFAGERLLPAVHAAPHSALIQGLRTNGERRLVFKAGLGETPFSAKISGSLLRIGQQNHPVSLKSREMMPPRPIGKNNAVRITQSEAGGDTPPPHQQTSTTNTKPPKNKLNPQKQN